MKKLFNQNGISLVEVLVAAGALAVVSLGVMKLMETTGKANVTMVANNDIAQMVREINGILSSPNNCRASLLDKKENDSIDFIYRVNPSDPNNLITAFEVGMAKVGNTFVVPKNQLYLASARVKSIQQNEHFNNVTRIELTFKRPQSSSGGQDLNREITLVTNHCSLNYIEKPTATEVVSNCSNPKVLIAGPTKWVAGPPDVYWGTCRDCIDGANSGIKHCYASDNL